MSGTTRTTADLDPRRKRILYRAWHRGTREMDLLMGPFCDADIDDMSDRDLDDFERLIDVPDRDLYAWITGGEAVPTDQDCPVLRRMQAFHDHRRPRFA